MSISKQNSCKQKKISFSKEVLNFANDHEKEFICKCGKVIGRIKVFEVFRRLGLINKKNYRLQSGIKYFEKSYKNLPNGFRVDIIRVYEEFEDELVKKVKSYIKENCVCKSSKPLKIVKKDDETLKREERETALDAARTMAKMKKTYAAELQVLQDEYGFTDEELDII